MFVGSTCMDRFDLAYYVARTLRNTCFPAVRAVVDLRKSP